MLLIHHFDNVWMIFHLFIQTKKCLNSNKVFIYGTAVLVLFDVQLL